MDAKYHEGGRLSSEMYNYNPSPAHFGIYNDGDEVTEFGGPSPLHNGNGARGSRFSLLDGDDGASTLGSPSPMTSPVRYAVRGTQKL